MIPENLIGNNPYAPYFVELEERAVFSFEEDVNSEVNFYLGRKAFLAINTIELVDDIDSARIVINHSDPLFKTRTMEFGDGEIFPLKTQVNVLLSFDPDANYDIIWQYYLRGELHETLFDIELNLDKTTEIFIR